MLRVIRTGVGRAARLPLSARCKVEPGLAHSVGSFPAELSPLGSAEAIDSGGGFLPSHVGIRGWH